MPHYHIRWSSGMLDWQRFNTHTQAEESAKQLLLRGETFTIETFDEGCEVCKGAAAKRAR